MSEPSNTPIKPEIVWRAEISGLLRDLTAEVLALTEIVLVMNEKLAAAEETKKDA